MCRSGRPPFVEEVGERDGRSPETRGDPMTTTTTTPTATTPTSTAPTTTSGAAGVEPVRAARRALRRRTLAVGAAAALATTATAAVLHAAGVTFEVDGEAIPLLGFAQMTFLWTLVGGLLAGSLRKRAQRPARRFVQVTVGLTALSCVPSLTAPASTGTRLALCATHLVAAAIVIPVLARRLGD
jgi:hypothetical protein